MRTISRLAPASQSMPLAPHQLPCARNGKHQPQRLRAERGKAVSLVQGLAASNEISVSAIENVEQVDRNPERLGRLIDPNQRVNPQVRAKTPALEALVDSDHRNEGGRNQAMAGPGSRVPGRQLRIIDGMRVDCVEPNQFAVIGDQDEDAQIIRSGKLVRRPPEEIVDLIDAGRKTGPIMPLGIERLEPRFGRRHRLEYRSW